MISDTKLRPRASSSSSSSSRHARTAPSIQTVKPNSAHTSDEFLADFLNPSFDPAAYLNTKLPPLAPRPASSSSAVSSAAAGAAGGAVPLSELSHQANALLSQLNAQTTRLSSTLTQLTDDILRSGSRLAYEVELLRGETLSFNETLHETLREEVERFVPGGLRGDATGEDDDAGEGQRGDKQSRDLAMTTTTTTATPSQHTEEKKSARQQSEKIDSDDEEAVADGTAMAKEPSCVKQLQTLTLVRARIDQVVKTFGDAMDFSFPPSEVSVSSSFLSVSAPEPGSEQQSSEEKGQQVVKRLRDEISGLLRPGNGGGGGDGNDAVVVGIEKAANRIEELKELTRVWKGTAEEKGRSRFIESLAKMVEDRHRELMREMDQQQLQQQQQQQQQRRQQSVTSPTKRAVAADGLGGRTGLPAAADEGKLAQLPGGFGLISQLQKLRSGL